MIQNAAIFYQYLIATKINLFPSACKQDKPVTKQERERKRWRQKKILVQKGARGCTWKWSLDFEPVLCLFCALWLCRTTAALRLERGARNKPRPESGKKVYRNNFSCR